MNEKRDMSDTFVADIGQKSAVADDIESLEEYDDSFKVNHKYPKNDYENNSKKTNKNPIWTVLLVILALIIGAGGSYYYFEVLTVDSKVEDTTTAKDEVSDKIVSNNQELEPEGVFITELINRYDAYNVSNTEIYTNLYEKESITPSEMDQEYIKLTAAKKALSKGSSIGFSPNTSFTSEEYQRSLKELYGNKVSVVDGDIGYPTYVYDAKNKKYDYKPVEAGSTVSAKMERKNVKAIKTADKLEVNVAVAKLEFGENKVLTGVNSDEIDGLNAETFDIDTDYAKLSQYKYTFDYDSTEDNYILSSIELVK